jgi:SRSO17 transposase
MTSPHSLDPVHMSQLAAYAAQFSDDFRQAKTAGWASVYLQGLLGDVDRKSIESLSRQVTVPPGLPDTDPKQALHHFINHSPWDEHRVWRRYRGLMSTAFASDRGCWVVNTIGLRKRGRSSVGVDRQPCGPAGRQTNCQVAVALHFVGPAGHFPLGLRLFLPPAWLDDTARLDRAGVPAAERGRRSMAQIALDLLDQVREEGVPGWAVVAGQDFGASASFRSGLTARGIPFAANVPAAAPVILRSTPGIFVGGSPGPAAGAIRIASVEKMATRSIPMTANSRVEGRLVWPAGDPDSGEHAAGAPVQLLTSPWSNRRSRKFWFADLPRECRPEDALELIRALDVMDRDYELIGAKLGLYHYEGRSWRGFHHHACMLMLAFGFLALHGEVAPADAPPPTAS